jgi:hypothetical protein
MSEMKKGREETNINKETGHIRKVPGSYLGRDDGYISWCPYTVQANFVTLLK